MIAAAKINQNFIYQGLRIKGNIFFHQLFNHFCDRTKHIIFSFVPILAKHMWTKDAINIIWENLVHP